MEIESFNLASLLIAFVFGAASFLSPCVLPLLPGYLSMMSGYSAQEIAEGDTSSRRMLRVSLLFVMGFTAVFVALGATATTFGRTLLRNSDLTNTVGGILIIVLGLFIAVTALWNPTFLMPFMRERRMEVRPSRLGAWAPPVMGVAFGFGWTPCIGPTLASILAIAATQQTVAEGMILLAFYGLGLGLPFVLFAIGIDRLYGALSWFRRHLKPITIVSGVLLAFFGVLMLTGQITELNRWFQRVLPELPFNS
ncbi:MAG: cytochrome c biogenesis protein CcdA [Actinobacteria bacterium]|nr:cytochrome c biogenesis protein CcdA [Actinomycetota bacterium]